MAGEPNRFIYLDLVPQHPGVGTYVHPLLEHAEFGPYPANMTKRNAFRGPGRWSFDAALSKDFSLTSGRRLQFRLEVYNVFNHANLYIMSGGVYVDSQDYIPA